MEKIKKLLQSNNWEDTVLTLIIGKEILTNKEFESLFFSRYFPITWKGATDFRYRCIKKGENWYALGHSGHRSLWQMDEGPTCEDIIL